MRLREIGRQSIPRPAMQTASPAEGSIVYPSGGGAMESLSFHRYSGEADER